MIKEVNGVRDGESVHEDMERLVVPAILATAAVVDAVSHDKRHERG